MVVFLVARPAEHCSATAALQQHIVVATPCSGLELHPASRCVLRERYSTGLGIALQNFWRVICCAHIPSWLGKTSTANLLLLVSKINYCAD